MIEEIFSKEKAKVYLCDFKHIRNLLTDFHYKKSAIGGSILTAFAMYYCDVLSGGAVIGPPRHKNKYESSIDIRRMVCTDDSPKNSESWLLSQIIRWIASNTDAKHVLSYSDMTANHKGTIYQAANFKFKGTTNKTKYVIWNGKTYHMRSINIDRPYSYKLRDALKNNEAQIITGQEKKIWIYDIPKTMKKKKKSINRIEDLMCNSLFKEVK
jgi:hypothetical protein